MLNSIRRGYHGCVSHIGVTIHSWWRFCSPTWIRHRLTKLNGWNAYPFDRSNLERKCLSLPLRCLVSRLQIREVDLWDGLQIGPSVGDPTDCWVERTQMRLASNRKNPCVPWIRGLLLNFAYLGCVVQRGRFPFEGTTAICRNLSWLELGKCLPLCLYMLWLLCCSLVTLAELTFHFCNRILLQNILPLALGVWYDGGVLVGTTHPVRSQLQEVSNHRFEESISITGLSCFFFRRDLPFHATR